MKSKFQTIYENYVGRNSKGGFLPGDFVKFKSNALSHPSIKAGTKDYIDTIQSLINSDLNLRLDSLTSYAATKSPDSSGTADQYMATIYSTLPGNSASSTDNLITVPLSVLEKVEDSHDESQMEIPKSIIGKRSSKSNHTGENKSTADIEDKSYDSGEDWRGGKRI